MKRINPLALFVRLALFFIFTFTIHTLSLLLPSPLHASTLKVGNKPSGVAVNTATDKAIVANQKDNTVSVVDLTTGTVTATIPVGEHPVGAAINESTNQAVVTNKKIRFFRKKVEDLLPMSRNSLK